MTYSRVIPRDLFNEGNLLTCLGRLTIALEDVRGHAAVLLFDDEDEEGAPATFDVRQDETDGSIHSATVALAIRGDVVRLFRPLNARAKWPLWVRVDEDDVRVFTDDGDLSPEFRAMIGAGQ